ncbi:MAG: VCBS repeat-containing protein, partial [Proteobacteria bacterium]|nr:VCBS repeat-containing protein [Pseudomonadota bacterium]
LHLNHGLSVCDVDADGRQDILVGARDGLIWYEPPAEDLCDPWTKWVISELESSETWAADIDGDGVNEILSIEPWHGNELVIYKCEGDIRRGPWKRTIVDATLNRGHSIQALDFDGDGRVELISGYNGEGTELSIYRQSGGSGSEWEKEVVDDGLGMGQMEILDIDGDGRLEIVATGMSTGNVRCYKGESEI